MIIQVLTFLAGVLFLGIGFFDLWKKQIPNWASYSLLAAAWILALFQGEWLSAILGVAVCGGLFFLAWLVRGAGGGDVKLMAAAGAWAGWPRALDVLVYVSVLGAVWVCVLWVWGRVRDGKGIRGRIPYGLPIGLGTAMVLWWVK